MPSRIRNPKTEKQKLKAEQKKKEQEIKKEIKAFQKNYTDMFKKLSVPKTVSKVKSQAIKYFARQRAHGLAITKSGLIRAWGGIDGYRKIKEDKKLKQWVEIMEAYVLESYEEILIRRDYSTAGVIFLMKNQFGWRSTDEAEEKEKEQRWASTLAIVFQKITQESKEKPLVPQQNAFYTEITPTIGPTGPKEAVFAEKKESSGSDKAVLGIGPEESEYDASYFSSQA